VAGAFAALLFTRWLLVETSAPQAVSALPNQKENS